MGTFESFDPNATSKQKPQWATFVEGRTPQFKVHAQRHHAVSALTMASILYRHDGARWVEVTRRPRKPWPERCEHCQATTMRRSTYRNVDYNHGQFVFVRAGRKLMEPLIQMFLCVDCRSLNDGS